MYCELVSFSATKFISQPVSRFAGLRSNFFVTRVVSILSGPRGHKAILRREHSHDDFSSDTGGLEAVSPSDVCLSRQSGLSRMASTIATSYSPFNGLEFCHWQNC
jgi:hypothetical protein